MEPNFQGDLTDILRGSTNSANSSGFGDQSGDATWHFSSETITNDSSADFPSSATTMINIPDPMPFGDPFSNMRDPLLQGPSAFFGGDAAPEFFGPSHEVKFRPSCNGFSRMLQINPGIPAPDHPGGTVQCDNSASPRGGAVKAGNGVVIVAAETAAAGGGMQISSPRNAGIKRRKSQAKKVVCIPAPAAANSRTSGEVVPSDLWAWRKYGQKPIKGSPYPRGYYRCSSSKGCSARKQVERSRTEPNMLVITYTSEHNHPWPTQRNALAGSTRSQPSKTGNASSKGTMSLIMSSHNQQLGQVTNPTSTSSKEDPDINNVSVSVKEENIDITDRLEDDGEVAFGYRPALCSDDVVSGNDQDALFAELGEIESDPLDLLFSQGFASSVDHNHQHKGLAVTTRSNNNNDNDNININNDNDKSLDPFAMFDWSEVNSSDNNKQRE